MLANKKRYQDPELSKLIHKVVETATKNSDPDISITSFRILAQSNPDYFNEIVDDRIEELEKLAGSAETHDAISAIEFTALLLTKLQNELNDEQKSRLVSILTTALKPETIPHVAAKAFIALSKVDIKVFREQVSILEDRITNKENAHFAIMLLKDTIDQLDTSVTQAPLAIIISNVNNEKEDIARIALQAIGHCCQTPS